jgi:hypothetical protein
MYFAGLRLSALLPHGCAFLLAFRDVRPKIARRNRDEAPIPEERCGMLPDSALSVVARLLPVHRVVIQ